MKTLKLFLRDKVNEGNIDGVKQRDERVMELIPVGWKDLDGYLKMGRIKLTLMGLEQRSYHCTVKGWAGQWDSQTSQLYLPSLETF